MGERPEGNRCEYVRSHLDRELPHRLGTGLWVGHCVPHGEPYAADTGLSCAMLLPPLLVPVEFETLDVGDREIRFLAVFLLHSAELQYKLDNGTDALLDVLDAAGLTEAVKLERPSVVPRRRRQFGLR